MSNKIRTCIVCKTKADKQDFIKFVRSKNGEICLDKDQRLEGRGCYVCNKTDCINKIKKSKAFNRAYKINVSEDMYDRVLEGLKDYK